MALSSASSSPSTLVAGAGVGPSLTLGASLISSAFLRPDENGIHDQSFSPDFFEVERMPVECG